MVARLVAMPLGMQAEFRLIPTSSTFFCEDLVMKIFLCPFHLFCCFKKSRCQLIAKECMLITGKLLLVGLPRNSVVRIADSPDINLAVYCACKATNQSINIFSAGRAVMLEQPRKTGMKVTSHMLTSHGGEIFIHTIYTARSILEDPPSISEGLGGRVTDYRIPVSCVQSIQQGLYWGTLPQSVRGWVGRSLITDYL